MIPQLRFPMFLLLVLILLFNNPIQSYVLLPSSLSKSRMIPSSSNQLFASVDVRSTMSTPSSPLPTTTPSSSQQDDTTKSIRSRLRQLTGFSLTAFRTSLRAIVMAIYVTTFTATGAWIRTVTKYVLSIFPPWARYFVQPFLILYYVPLYLIRNWTGPVQKKKDIQTHQQHMWNGWKSAVQKANDEVSYWPIHISTDGNYFESDNGSLELEKGIAESVNVAMDISME